MDESQLNDISHVRERHANTNSQHPSNVGYVVERKCFKSPRESWKSIRTCRTQLFQQDIAVGEIDRVKKSFARMWK